MTKGFGWRLLGSVTLCGLLATMAETQVSDSSGTATVNVQPALSLALVASPDWGKVTRPPTGTARYTLDYSTGSVSLTSGDGYTFNDGHAGEYTLTGAPTAPVSFSVAIATFSDSGVTVVGSHINGTTNSGTDNPDNTGSLTLKIGGVLDIASSATLTTQTATVTVTVDYQ